MRDTYIIGPSDFEWRIRHEVESRIGTTIDSENVANLFPSEFATVSFRTDKATNEKLDNLSNMTGLSKSELIRQMIADRLEWAHDFAQSRYEQEFPS